MRIRIRIRSPGRRDGRPGRPQHRRHAEHRLHGDDGVLGPRHGPGGRHRRAHTVRPGLQDDVGGGVAAHTAPGHPCRAPAT